MLSSAVQEMQGSNERWIESGTASLAGARAPARHDELPRRQRALHVLYGICGNRTALMDEFVVSLKSVLLNAPLDAAMEIHLAVDPQAYSELSETIFPRLALAGSKWRNPVTITLYPVSGKLQESHRDQIFRHLPNPNVTVARRVGPGALFRLFAHEILPPDREDMGPVLYLDKDVVVFANLAEVLDVQDPKYMYQIGTSTNLCSGIMIINLKKFSLFLHYLKQTYPRWLGKDFDDQAMLGAVKRLLRSRGKGSRRGTASASGNGTSTPPPLELVGDLPERWHVNRGHLWKTKPQKLRSDFPDGFGMLHFNGIRGPTDRWWFEEAGVMTYCEWDPECRSQKAAQKEFRESWSLAEYYIHLPFEAAKAYGRSQVRDDGGTPLVIRTVCPTATPDCEYPYS